MRLKLIIVLFFISFSGFYNTVFAESKSAHIEVSMRMIGHQVLLESGDSTSRILPIQKIDNQYKIEFNTLFSFDPENIYEIVDSVLTKTKISENYIVEIKACLTDEVYYSYEVAKSKDDDIIPCRTRSQENACYYILITLLDLDLMELKDVPNQEKNTAILWIIGALVFLIVIGIFLFLKKGKPTIIDDDTILIGEYRFKKNQMALLYKDECTELSSKETDLLFLLYSAANTTIERGEILNRVWGDEGDYVGRTLDVFISKLRKKLENDQSIKITNIRGIGYKLILNIRQ